MGGLSSGRRGLLSLVPRRDNFVRDQMNEDKRHRRHPFVGLDDHSETRAYVLATTREAIAHVRTAKLQSLPCGTICVSEEESQRGIWSECECDSSGRILLSHRRELPQNDTRARNYFGIAISDVFDVEGRGCLGVRALD
jgi:hypothetical protein